MWKPCEHHPRWEPIQGWMGRYKCPACGVVAYRGKNVVVQLETPRADAAQAFITYKCPACSGDTTGRGKVCPACRK